MSHDLVIIGCGFAGLSAALQAGRLGLSTLVLDPIGMGGQILNTDRIENYPGFPDGISGMNLVTAQTGPEGKEVRKVLIEEGLAIKTELYVSFLVDRSIGWPVCIASSAGGMEIEKVAAGDVEIAHQWVNLCRGVERQGDTLKRFQVFQRRIVADSIRI